jgi:hypothetical protein
MIDRRLISPACAFSDQHSYQRAALGVILARQGQ